MAVAVQHHIPSTDQRLFSVHRLGMVMDRREGDPLEAEGVTNPACARGPDGELYLFPRMISHGNYSRIGVARVRFDQDGDPRGVERLGVALEPTETFEKNSITGGCEDPRITFLEPFGQYVMTYTAFSPKGPRIALASSRDLITWQRQGLVNFNPTGTFDFNLTDNKDAVVFPRLLTDPIDGAPSIGFIHRPLPPSRPSRLTRTESLPPNVNHIAGDRARLHHESIWISYCNRPKKLGHLVNLHSHHRLMSPHAYWERAKVGAGPPPVLTRLGWLMVYHGVAGHEGPHRYFRYSAGIAILDADRPEHILYRSQHPIYDAAEEPTATRSHRIVFPTGVDQRVDLGDPDRFDLYYGVADSSIAVASLRLPVSLPEAQVPEELRDARIA